MVLLPLPRWIWARLGENMSAITPPSSGPQHPIYLSPENSAVIWYEAGGAYGHLVIELGPYQIKVDVRVEQLRALGNCLVAKANEIDAYRADMRKALHRDCCSRRGALKGCDR